MAEKSFIYFRIFGYVATIVMHTGNTVFMAAKLESPDAQELFKDPTIKFFNDNQARYFTCWTFFLQVVYAAAGLACDLLTLRHGQYGHADQYRPPKRLRKFRDTLFSAIQWPCTLLVSMLFWFLFTLDRELIFPVILDKVLTRTSNHIIHSCIVPVVLWEIVFQPRVEPRSHWWNLAHITLHYVLYFSVLFYTYFEKGVWIYPVFAVTAGTIYFPLFMIMVYLSLIVFYYIQWPITRFIHGVSGEKTKKIK